MNSFCSLGLKWIVKYSWYSWELFINFILWLTWISSVLTKSQLVGYMEIRSYSWTHERLGELGSSLLLIVLNSQQLAPYPVGHRIWAYPTFIEHEMFKGMEMGIFKVPMSSRKDQLSQKIKLLDGLMSSHWIQWITGCEDTRKKGKNTIKTK